MDAPKYHSQLTKDKKMKKQTKERKKIEVILKTPFSNREIATLVVISDAVSVEPLIIERILEEQIHRIVETLMLNGLYTLKK
jgi:hypothetical protein